MQKKINHTNKYSQSKTGSGDIDSVIKNLEKKVNIIVAKRELEIYRATKKKYLDKKIFSKINNWVNSSAVRSAFARLTVLAYYEKKFVSVEKVTFELNISRPAAKTMFEYCLKENWVCQNDFGCVQASQFSVQAFSIYVRKLSEKTTGDLEDFYSLQLAINAIKKSVKSKIDGK